MRQKPGHIAKRLGASREIEIETKADGPLSWMQIQKEANERLRSTGGRPSNPLWSIRRQVPFQVKTWNLLKRVAESFENEGINVSPGQIAALIIERQSEWLETCLDKSSLNAMREKLRHRRISTNKSTTRLTLGAKKSPKVRVSRTHGCKSQDHRLA